MKISLEEQSERDLIMAGSMLSIRAAPAATADKTEEAAPTLLNPAA
jgi:hypothetical protein